MGWFIGILSLFIIGILLWATWTTEKKEVHNKSVGKAIHALDVLGASRSSSKTSSGPQTGAKTTRIRQTDSVRHQACLVQEQESCDSREVEAPREENPPETPSMPRDRSQAPRQSAPTNTDGAFRIREQPILPPRDSTPTIEERIRNSRQRVLAEDSELLATPQEPCSVERRPPPGAKSKPTVISVLGPQMEEDPAKTSMTAKPKSVFSASRDTDRFEENLAESIENYVPPPRTDGTLNLGDMAQKINQIGKLLSDIDLTFEHLRQTAVEESLSSSTQPQAPTPKPPSFREAFHEQLDRKSVV